MNFKIKSFCTFFSRLFFNKILIIVPFLFIKYCCLHICLQRLGYPHSKTKDREDKEPLSSLLCLAIKIIKGFLNDFSAIKPSKKRVLRYSISARQRAPGTTSLLALIFQSTVTGSRKCAFQPLLWHLKYQPLNPCKI